MNTSWTSIDRTNKYNAKKTDRGRRTFDSKREAERYDELKLLERAGKIHQLELQKEFELIPAQYIDGKLAERALKYRADFCYIDNTGKYVVEDVKGCCKGPAWNLFRAKCKIMLKRYGIIVRVVK